RQAHRAPPRPGRRELITAPNARVLRCAAAALALAAVAGVTALAHAADGPTADDLRAAVTPGSTLRVDGQPLRTEVLRDFYTSLDFGLVWGSEPDGVARTGLALDALLGARDHGLNPAHYGVPALRKRAEPATPAMALERELLLTDSLLRYAVDVRAG